MPHLLSPEQIETYHREGFVVIPGLYEPAAIDRARAIIANDVATGGWATAPYHADDVTTDIYERMPELADLVLSEGFFRAMEDLFGADCWVLAEPAVHRGRYYDWHKDSTFLDALGEDFHRQDGFAAAMTVLYLQENHPEYGGGLTVIPRTQHTPDFYHRVPMMNAAERAWLKAQKLVGRSHYDRMNRHPGLHPIASNKGDLLVIDLRLDHRGTPALKPPPVEKFAIMSIACTGHTTAHRLSDALRRRPYGYYRDYLAGEPETTPVLERIAEAHEARIIL